jgi:hypothetical protein
MCLVDYFNDAFSQATGNTNRVIRSALTPRQEAESPPVTLSLTAPLPEILDQLAVLSLVRWTTSHGHVVLLPDLPARRAYAQAHAGEWKRAAEILTTALEALRRSATVTLWDPATRCELPPITTRNHVAVLADWIESQPLAYDAINTKARAEGAVCGCLPWVIEFGLPKQVMAVHAHNLVVDDRTSFRPARTLDLGALRHHLRASGILATPQ